MKKTIMLSKNQPTYIHTMDKGERCSFLFKLDGSVPFHAYIRFVFANQDSHADISIRGVFGKNGAWSALTEQHHVASYTKSTLHTKTVLDGKATFTCTGSVVIEKNLTKVVASQRHDSILFSSNASVITLPKLFIQSHDVICTHKATVSDIPKDILCFLRSRGVLEKTAKQLYIQGFLAYPDDICETIT